MKGQAMSDTRQVLEEAFKVIFGTPPTLSYEDWQDGNFTPEHRRFNRFRRFLDAEAWTDAAMMLLDRTRWRILSLHETEVEDAPPFEIRLGQRGAGFGRARIVHGTGETEALALAQACLKARENADG